MLVLPIILTMFMFSFVILVLVGITGIEDIRQFRDANVFFGAIKRMENLRQNTSLAEFLDIQAKIEEFNNTYGGFGIVLSIYEEADLLFPASDSKNRISQIVLAEGGSYLMADGSDAAYSAQFGDYTLLLTSSDFSYNRNNPLDEYLYVVILLFTFSIVIVVIVNRALTRFVTQKITTPLELLVSGVHELRDGNLAFRIDYDYNDEFKSVCDDFNEMAQRLSDMVTDRQKDEKSRKELIAGISHDLRTPLTSIKAYVEGIEKGVATTPQAQARYIETIKGKTADLEHIINQLFLFSKLDIGEFPLKVERVGMNKALNEFLFEAASEYENRGLSIMFTENVNELYANIDILQFRNVLHNILGNSAKYKIDNAANSRISCGEEDADIIISVVDNGPGVPAADIDKLFDVFYRADVSRKDPSDGSGLGLAIARKVVERLGGTIHAENVPHGGLAVIITLPKVGGAV